jgi:hypothetical protein
MICRIAQAGKIEEGATSVICNSGSMRGLPYFPSPSSMA